MIGLVMIADRIPLPGGLTSIAVDQTTGGVKVTLPTGITWDKVGGMLITNDAGAEIVRYSTDPDTDPTASVGIEILGGGGVFIGSPRACEFFRAFCETATTSTLQVQLYGRYQ